MSAIDFRFRFAVDAILKNWDALQMVVGHGAAGPESAKIAAWMVDATVQWFGENKDLENRSKKIKLNSDAKNDSASM